MNHFEYARTKFREYVEQKGSTAVADEIKDLMINNSLNSGPTLSEYLKSNYVTDKKYVVKLGENFTYSENKVSFQDINNEVSDSFKLLFTNNIWQEVFRASANGDCLMELQS